GPLLLPATALGETGSLPETEHRVLRRPRAPHRLDRRVVRVCGEVVTGDSEVHVEEVRILPGLVAVGVVVGEREEALGIASAGSQQRGAERRPQVATVEGLQNTKQNQTRGRSPPVL